MDLIIGKFRIKLELIIIFVLLCIIMSGHLVCSCTRVKPYEAFTEMVDNMITCKDGKKINDEGKCVKITEGFTSGMNNGVTFSRFPEKPININSWKQSSGMSGSRYKTTKPPGKGGKWLI